MTPSKENSPSMLIELYKVMQLIRRSQEILSDEYHPADEMRCPIHFCIGQEAPPAALSLILQEDDVVFSHHRSHGYYLAKGAPLADMVAEFYGKSTGSNGGLAGSQELSHEHHNFYSGTVLSGAFALAGGAAFAAKYRDTNAISVGVIGDGGMEEGIVFETINLAAVQKLPVLFLCENNGYSIHSPLPERSLSPHLIERAEAFGIQTHLLDGNDALSLHGQLSEIIAGMRQGQGPAFVEVMTYRYCGHVGPEGDDHYGYRPESEMLEWKQRDPIRLVLETLRSKGDVEDQITKINEDVDAHVLAAIKAAKEAPFPAYDEMLAHNISDGYAPVVTQLIEGAVSDFDFSQEETKLGPY